MSMSLQEGSLQLERMINKKIIFTEIIVATLSFQMKTQIQAFGLLII